MAEHGKFTRRDVRECWDDVLPGLADIKEKRSPSWRPEDVYAACLSGKAFLYVADCCGCFVVLQEKQDAHSLRRDLLVWIGYGFDDAQGAHVHELLELARKIEAKRLVMISPRKGFERTGWTIDTTTYFMEVL
jgi:hypothetical protein